ncbi:MAG: alpha-rhamnosidase, partial [Holophagae bacterium]|nr:alpha-rhamnosidase [Holophagae bacterium]
NCYLVMCLDRMEKIASLLGKPEESSEFSQKRNRLSDLVHKTFYREDLGIYADGDQTDLAFPLITGVVPEELREKVTENLLKNVSDRHSGHLATGLVGVPVMTEWATSNRAVDLMSAMLKSRDYPGYLYMIDNGATTTWENWDGERSRIHNCFNGIGSWFYQAPGGIRPVDGFPAYKKFIIDPQVPEGLEWAKTDKNTPYGKIQVSWETADGRMIMEALVPVGTGAEVVIPEKASAVSVNGKPAADENILLQSGRSVVEWAL